MTWTPACASIITVLCQLATAATVPALEWSKRFGGSQDESINSVTSDQAGNIYIAGTTTSLDLPANGAFRQIGATNLRRVNPSGTGTIEVLRSPLAGIVRAMTVTSDALYVASTAGVMFARNGNGTTWEILPTGPVQKRFISSIAVEPGSPAVIYLAAGGLWKTSNGGINWAAVAGTGEFYGQPAQVYSVSIDPRHSGTVYAIGLAGAFRSSDGGASWARLPDKISSIAFDVQRSEVVYAGGYQQLRISENSGVDWTPLPGPGLFQPEGVIVDPSRPGTIYVRSGDRYHRSSDRGQTWKLLSISTFNLTASADVPVLYAHAAPYGTNSLMQSRDGGDTWTSVARNLFRSEAAQLIEFRGAVFLGGSTPQSAFAAKFGPGGNLVWSTYLPGTAVFAVTTGPDQSVYFSASCMKSTPLEASPCTNDYSSFVVRLAADGQQLVYSREYSTGVFISSIAVDGAGSALLTGVAGGRIPTTPGALWPDPGNIPGFFPNTSVGRIFAAKFSPDGGALTYSTYLGDWAQASFGFPIGATPGSIVVERSGHAIVAGPLIWKLGPYGTTLDYSTKIGNRVSGGALDSSDHLYVLGAGDGGQLYTSPGSYLTAASGPSIGFVTKLSSAGEFLESTLLGAANGGRIALGTDDSLLLSGLQYGGATRSLIDSAGSGFVASLDASLSTLLFATPIEGAPQIVAAPRPGGGVAVAYAEGGAGTGADSPSGSDIVLRAYRLMDSEVRVDAIVNAASNAAGPLAPRELVIIRGAGLGRNPRVRVQGVEWPVLRSSESELWVMVPDDLAMVASKGELTVESGGQQSQAVGVGFAEASPALFTADGSGTGQALAFNADGTLNSASSPAPRGSILGLLVNGLGKHRIEGASVVPPHTLSVIFDNTYAYGVDANLISAPGLPGPAVQVKVFVPSNFSFVPTQSFPTAIRVWINVESAGHTPIGPTVWVR